MKETLLFIVFQVPGLSFIIAATVRYLLNIHNNIDTVDTISLSVGGVIVHESFTNFSFVQYVSTQVMLTNVNGRDGRTVKWYDLSRQ